MTQPVGYPQHFIRLPWKLSGTQLYSSYFRFNATWLCILSIKIASFPLTKVWEKVIINCIRGYIARAHVKFLFHLVDESRSKKCLKDLNLNRGATLLYLSWTDSIGTHFALLTHFLFWLYQGLALVRHITEHFFSSKVILTCNLFNP